MSDFPPPMPPTTPPGPKRLYNIVAPAALARIYAASLIATATANSTLSPDDHRRHAQNAVRDFVDLMRSDHSG